MELNIKTWGKYAPDMEIVLLNESNIKDWIPDLPQEFFRLPYDQVKSDVMRAVSRHGNGVARTAQTDSRPVAPSRAVFLLACPMLPVVLSVQIGRRHRQDRYLCAPSLSTPYGCTRVRVRVLGRGGVLECIGCNCVRARARVCVCVCVCV